MKHVLYLSIFALVLGLVGCNQKKLAQQIDLANKAEKEAKEQQIRSVVEQRLAQEQEKKALIALEQAEKARRVAQEAKAMAEKQTQLCREENAKLQKRLDELQKKK